MTTSREGRTREKHSLTLKLHRIIILFLLLKTLKENLKNNVLYFYNRQV